MLKPVKGISPTVLFSNNYEVNSCLVFWRVKENDVVDDHFIIPKINNSSYLALELFLDMAGPFSAHFS